MKRKGFTLIELLAVIVILAIIALIATPIVMNIIENARKSAAERSAESYVRTVEAAVLSARMEDGEIISGTYKVDEDGNLCPVSSDCSESEEDKLIIDVSGDKLNEGSTVIVESGVVQLESSSLSVGEYVVVYNDEKKPVATNEMVVLLSDSDGDGEVSIGDKYSVDPGDGIRRIFYVLELGSNPVTGSTLEEDEVALIMNSNIDNTTMAWGNVEDTTSTIALAYLQEKTSDWTVDVSMPTYNQLNDAATAINYQYEGSFMWENISSVETPNGYWMYDENADTTTNANAHAVYKDSRFFSNSNIGKTNSEAFGVRPVITVSMSEF